MAKRNLKKGEEVLVNYGADEKVLSDGQMKSYVYILTSPPPCVPLI